MVRADRGGFNHIAQQGVRRWAQVVNAPGGPLTAVPRVPACLACDGRSDVAGERSGYHYFRCGSCGLYFVHPRPRMEELARWYGPGYYTGEVRDELGHVVGYENYDEEGPRDARHLFAWLQKKLGIVRGLRVLDAGCARGYLLRELVAAGAQVQGVEFSDDARRRFVVPGARLYRTIEDADIDRHAFDLVVMAEYLEHTLDPRAVVRRAHTLLKPDGRLALTVPNGDQRSVAVYGVRYHSFTAPVHLQVFTLRSLLAMTKELFVPAHCEPHWPNVNNAMPRWLIAALRIPREAITFDGFAQRYVGPSVLTIQVLRLVRAYRFYLRRRALHLNMGLRLILRPR